MKRKSFAEL